MSAKDNIKKLSETDTWSILLFALYQIKGIPELSSLSEMVYLVSKESLLNLCEYYGGETIRIPTIDELATLLKTLTLYQFVELDNLSLEDGIKKSGINTKERECILSYYDSMKEILKKYEFTPRSN